MSKKYSIFLSTCDAYRDCWDPFFYLFMKYWPDYDGIVYMVTDNLTYSYDGVKIKCLNINNLKGIDSNTNLSWGKRMRWAMEMMESDMVLFMQEDFFIRGKVDDRQIDEFASLMIDNPDIKCLHLTRPEIKDSTPSEYKHLYNVKLKQRYRVDCQPALWRKDELYNVMDDNDSPWQFEVFGSKRSAKMAHRYLIVDKNWVKKGKYEIIPYVATGIAKAQWEYDVIPVFKENGIEIDFSKRGFYDKGTIFKRIVRAFDWRIDLYVRELKKKLGMESSSF